MSAKSPPPISRESEPSMGLAWNMSRATPAGLLVGDVDDDDVGELLDGDGARNGGADVAGAAHNSDFAVHGIGLRYMFSMMASANCDVFSSVAPSISRARS